MPRAGADAFERSQLVLHDFLRRACKPFADALVSPPPPLHELKPEVPASFVCVQWHEITSMLGGATVEPSVTLVYVLARPPDDDGTDGRFAVGAKPLTRAGVLATSRLLQHQLTRRAPDTAADALGESVSLCVSCSCRPPSLPPSHPSSRRSRTLTPMLLDADADAAPTPLTEQAAVAAVEESSLPLLAALFDPLTGGMGTDEPLCAWLGTMLLALE